MPLIKQGNKKLKVAEKEVQVYSELLVWVLPCIKQAVCTIEMLRYEWLKFSSNDKRIYNTQGLQWFIDWMKNNISEKNDIKKPRLNAGAICITKHFYCFIFFSNITYPQRSFFFFLFTCRGFIMWYSVNFGI